MPKYSPKHKDLKRMLKIFKKFQRNAHKINLSIEKHPELLEILKTGEN